MGWASSIDDQGRDLREFDRPLALSTRVRGYANPWQAEIVEDILATPQMRLACLIDPDPTRQIKNAFDEDLIINRIGRTNSFYELSNPQLDDLVTDFEHLEASGAMWDLATVNIFDTLTDVLWREDGKPITVLDVGCGAGTLAKTLVEKYPQVESAIGFEKSPALVRELNRRQSHPNIHFVQANAHDLENAWQQHFGSDAERPWIVTSRFLGEHLSGDFGSSGRQQRLAAYLAMHRLVSPGGWVVGADWGNITMYGPMKDILEAGYRVSGDETKMSVGISERIQMHRHFPESTLSRTRTWQPPWHFVSDNVARLLDFVQTSIDQGDIDRPPREIQKLLRAVDSMRKLLPRMRSSTAGGPYCFEVHEWAVKKGELPEHIRRAGRMDVRKTALIEEKRLPA